MPSKMCSVRRLPKRVGQVISETERSVYSDEVLKLFCKYSAMPRYAGSMRGMSVAQFVDRHGLNTRRNVFRQIELFVDVADEVDIRDETRGHYRFTASPVDRQWYEKLEAKMVRVLPLHADYTLRYRDGTELHEMDPWSILFDSERRAQLSLGSESEPLLSIDAAIEISDDEREAAEAQSEQERREAEARRLARVDMRHLSSEQLRHYYNKTARNSVEAFVDYLHSKNPRLWKDIFNPSNRRYIRSMVISQFGSAANYPSVDAKTGTSSLRHYAEGSSATDKAFKTDDGVDMVFGGTVTMLGNNMRAPHKTREGGSAKAGEREASQAVPISHGAVQFWTDAGIDNVHFALDKYAEKFVASLEDAFNFLNDNNRVVLFDAASAKRALRRALVCSRERPDSDVTDTGTPYRGHEIHEFIESLRPESHRMQPKKAQAATGSDEQVHVLRRSIRVERDGRVSSDDETLEFDASTGRMRVVNRTHHDYKNASDASEELRPSGIIDESPDVSLSSATKVGAAAAAAAAGASSAAGILFEHTFVSDKLGDARSSASGRNGGLLPAGSAESSSSFSDDDDSDQSIGDEQSSEFVCGSCSRPRRRCRCPVKHQRKCAPKQQSPHKADKCAPKPVKCAPKPVKCAPKQKQAMKAADKCGRARSRSCSRSHSRSCSRSRSRSRERTDRTERASTIKKLAMTDESIVGVVARTVKKDNDLNTLFDAVRALDLVSALQSPGPFTVFAPIDRAFERVNASSLSKEKLRQVVAFHVVPGPLDEALLLRLARENKSVKTLELTVNSDGSSSKKIGGAALSLANPEFTEFEQREKARIVLNGQLVRISKDPIKASNGLIWVINKVLLPAEKAPQQMAPPPARREPMAPPSPARREQMAPPPPPARREPMAPSGQAPPEPAPPAPGAGSDNGNGNGNDEEIIVEGGVRAELRQSNNDRGKFVSFYITSVQRANLTALSSSPSRTDSTNRMFNSTGARVRSLDQPPALVPIGSVLGGSRATAGRVDASDLSAADAFDRRQYTQSSPVAVNNKAEGKTLEEMMKSLSAAETRSASNIGSDMPALVPIASVIGNANEKSALRVTTVDADDEELQPLSDDDDDESAVTLAQLLKRKDNKSAADANAYKSNGTEDYDNFKVHFDRYMSKYGDQQHMRNGVVVLAPTSNVYTPAVASSLDGADDATFRKTIEKYIVLAEDRSVKASPGKGIVWNKAKNGKMGMRLNTDKATKRCSLKTMNGHDIVVYKKAKQEQHLLDHEDVRFRTPEVSNKYTNVCFYPQGNVF